MAFTQSTFAPIGGQSTKAPTVYSYTTSDNLATVTASNYFVDKKFELNEGDYIIAILNGSAKTLCVTSDTSTVQSAIGTASINLVAIGTHPVDQGPTALDTTYQVKFGNTIGVDIINVTGDITIDTAGACTVVTAGSYQLVNVLNYGRTGTSGTAKVNVRALVNGVQMGSSGDNWQTNQNDRLAKSTTLNFTFSAGDVLTFEIIRDSTGSNDGGLFVSDPVAAGWNDVGSALIAFYKLVVI